MSCGLATALLASTSLAAPARAQEAPVGEVAAEEVAGDIIVTATRRSESLQKVPISIQALGTETLEQRQVSSFDDYAKLLPSVTFNSAGPSQAQIYFRGINSGGDGLDVGSLPTTGLYLDDIPVTTIGNSVDLHIYDINRVEALAGPQGTLFGASSLAGTLRIITNKPDTGKFAAGYDLQLNKFGPGNMGGSGEGFVNIPLTDRIAIRLVGYYQHDGGYIDNTYKQRSFILDDKDPTTNVTVDNGRYLGKNINEVDSYGGRAALKVELDDDWTVTPQLVYQHQKAKGPFLFDPRVGDLKVHEFQDDRNLDRWYQAAATIEGKVGNWDLVYSGGYFERKVNNQNDYSYYTVAYDRYSESFDYSTYYTKFPLDGGGNYLDPTQQSYSDYKYTKQTHELRVSSPATERLRGTFGLFLQRQTGRLDTDYSTAGLSRTTVPITAFPNPGLYPLPGFGDAVFIKRLDRTDRDYAMFGQIDYDIVPSVTLTAGIRGFMVKNSLYGFSGITGGARRASCRPTTGRYPCISVDKVYDQSGETHKVSLAWRVDDQRMVYATYSTGFRPGGNDRRPTTPSYRADTLSNYEIGWKTSWLNGRLRINGAVFYQDWQDIQFSLPGENGQTYLLNAPGGAEVKGVEADVVWRLGRLQLSAAGAYIDAKLADDFCAGENDCTPKGTRLPTTAKIKLNGTARYTIDLGGGPAFVQASVLHQGGTRAGLLDSDTLPLADGTPQLGFTRAFTTFDFSAGKTFGSFALEAFIQNAFDKRGILSKGTACGLNACNANARVYPVRPQLFGIKASQRF